MARVEQQQLRYFGGFDLPVLPLVKLKRSHRFQHRHPEMTARFVQNLRAFQQLVVVDVQNAGGHLRALEDAAGLHKMPALVAGERGIADAVKTVPATLDRVAEPRQALVVVAELGTGGAPRTPFRWRCASTRGAVDLEASDELTYGVSCHLRAKQLLDFRSSKSVIGRATSLFGLLSGLPVEGSPAFSISNYLVTVVTDWSEVPRGV